MFFITLRSALVLLAIGSAAAVAPILCVPSPAALSFGGYDERPELHRVDVVGDAGARTFRLAGRYFGSRPGKIRVGGMRARVQQWDDSAVVFRMPGRLGGGAYGVELSTRDRLRPPLPLPLLVAGTARPQDRMKLRIGGHAYRHRASTPFQAEDAALAGTFERSLKREVTKVVKQKYRVCHTRKRCIGSFMGACIYRWYAECEWRTRRVTVRRVQKRTWTVDIRVPGFPEDLAAPRLITASDLAPGASSPITYSGPNGPIFEIDPTQGDWWIVIGRDASGAVCGQLSAVSPTGRQVSARFASGAP